MSGDLPVLAGIVATAIFVSSTVPMLTKAWQTRDLSSYSLGNLLMASAGNAVQSVYVFTLPVGPFWALHCFNLVATGLMLGWYLRYEWFGARPAEIEVLTEYLCRPDDPLAAYAVLVRSESAA